MKLHQHIFAPHGHFHWRPHIFKLLKFQIINKQLALFIYSAGLGDNSEPQQSCATLLKLGVTCTRAHATQRHLETFARKSGSEFHQKHSESALLTCHLTADAAITGQTLVSHLGILFPIIERKLAYPSRACWGNYVSKSQAINLSKHWINKQIKV